MNPLAQGAGFAPPAAALGAIVALAATLRFASPDGQTLAFGTDGQGVFLLDLTAGQ